MVEGSVPQWILTHPMSKAPRAGDGLFPGEVIEVTQVRLGTPIAPPFFVDDMRHEGHVLSRRQFSASKCRKLDDCNGLLSALALGILLTVSDVTHDIRGFPRLEVPPPPHGAKLTMQVLSLTHPDLCKGPMVQRSCARVLHTYVGVDTIAGGLCRQFFSRLRSSRLRCYPFRDRY